ncbi:MAG: hypothetical protein V6Z82_03780 [Flavobacteriales bacterium]
MKKIEMEKRWKTGPPAYMGLRCRLEDEILVPQVLGERTGMQLRLCA